MKKSQIPFHGLKNNSTILPLYYWCPKNPPPQKKISLSLTDQH